jgi:hypothetical protein
VSQVIHNPRAAKQRKPSRGPLRLTPTTTDSGWPPRILYRDPREAHDGELTEALARVGTRELVDLAHQRGDFAAAARADVAYAVRGGERRGEDAPQSARDPCGAPVEIAIEGGVALASSLVHGRH